MWKYICALMFLINIGLNDGFPLFSVKALCKTMIFLTDKTFTYHLAKKYLGRTISNQLKYPTKRSSSTLFKQSSVWYFVDAVFTICNIHKGDRNPLVCLMKASVKDTGMGIKSFCEIYEIVDNLGLFTMSIISNCESCNRLRDLCICIF